MTNFVKPCNGLITSLYGKSREDPFSGKVQPHWGTDYGNASDNTIIAAVAGTVTKARTTEADGSAKSS